jgi:hypothetical protein
VKHRRVSCDKTITENIPSECDRAEVNIVNGKVNQQTNGHIMSTQLKNGVNVSKLSYFL